MDMISSPGFVWIVVCDGARLAQATDTGRSFVRPTLVEGDGRELRGLVAVDWNSGYGLSRVRRASGWSPVDVCWLIARD